MKVYFLSAQPCILTLNGAYFGQTDTFERFIEVNAKDNVYAKFCPQNAGDIGFFLNEQLRIAPPDGCDVYLLKDGIAVYAHTFPPTDFCLHSIAQARFGDTLVTVYKQGVIQLCIQTASSIFNATLSPCFAVCKIVSFEKFFLLEGQNAFALFTKDARLLLQENFLSYQIDGEYFRAVLPLSDRLGRWAECEWKAQGDGIQQTQFCLKQAQGQSDNIRDELLPYAFLESVLIGADYTPFLSEELQQKADALKQFLGNFTNVVLTQNPNVCALVYPKGERLFVLRYFTVSVQNGKIINITG